MTMLKKFYYFLIEKYFGSPRFFNAIKSRKGEYLTLISRPKLAKDFFRRSDGVKNVPPLVLIIQGKILTDDCFTFETIKFYQKSFDNPTIIVSTHEGVDSPDILEKIKELGVEMVVSPKPKCCGPFNINLQITATVAGLKKAKELGFDYAIKTRSDVRLYGVNIAEFVFNLIKQFPIKPGFKQKERIISSNIFTLKYRPYSLSDMTVAGTVDDLLLYFDVPLDPRAKIDLNKDFSIDDYVRERPGEIYLETEFLKKLGLEFNGTVEDSWKIFANHFCVVDQQSFDSYWYKTQIYQHLENKFLRYGPEFGLQDLNFREWLNLYNRFGKN